MESFVFRIRPPLVSLGRNYWLAAWVLLGVGFGLLGAQALAAAPGATPAQFVPLTSVRLLDGPFAYAVKANRSYLLALKVDRLLTPYRQEAGLEPKAPPYGNWEGSGLAGHMGGHYLSALATMIASGADTPEGELRRRLDYMVAELDDCQKAWGNGYVGGVPGSRRFWQDVSAGRIQANGFGLNGKWVPWYNLHKTFAGLRDAYLVAGNVQAREVFLKCGNWCEKLVAGLSDEQMQNMLRAEHGGMNEVLADLYAITGEPRFLTAARRFCHQAVLDPLVRHQDELTGLHANTQIPKVVGLERIATLAADQAADSGARFFWDNVTRKRTVVFGGNSVSEHFNDPKNFGGMIEHREGPETCNTYNMLRLTEQLFAAQPRAAYADYYERALYNQILASINPEQRGYVYFTPIRPQHYRVYSQPEQGFWCCVGTGIENPGKYGKFIYAQATNGFYVNLFIASELSVTNIGLTLRQETTFPDEPCTRITVKLKTPAEFTLYLRHPAWVAAGEFVVRVNGKQVAVASTPSSYAELRREWRDGDRVELELPMHTTVERLPDGSDWVAILRGPIVLASPSGTNDLVGLFANDSRMGQVASGPLVPLDQAPVLLAGADDVPTHVKPDATGPLHFRLTDVVTPAASGGVPLVPFFRLHNARYQMYWQLTTKEEIAARRERIAAEERARALREANTLDRVAVGEQQPEVEHDFVGEKTDSGLRNGRRWRRGEWFQYTLNPHGEKLVELEVTYWGGETGRNFDLYANGQLLATETLNSPKPNEFFAKRYVLPAKVMAVATDGRVTIKFLAHDGSTVGGVCDVRLMKPESRSGGVRAAADQPAPRIDRNSQIAHEQLVEKARKGGIDIYFVGDSITRRWGTSDRQYRDLLQNWTTNFFGWNAGNFGWGADATQNILWRLEHGELDGVNPKIIVLLAGINNVGNVPGGAEKVADISRGLEAIVRICQVQAPGAVIVLTGLFPRNDNMAVIPEIRQINENLAKLADGKKIRYLNVNTQLADADGNLFPGMSHDKLHPTVKAYQIWADGLKPIFTEILGPPATTDHAPPPTGDPSVSAAPVR